MVGAVAKEKGSIYFTEDLRLYLKTQSFPNKCHTHRNFTIFVLSSFHQNDALLIFLPVNLIFYFKYFKGKQYACHY